MAMMLEAQALDLYLRTSHRCEERETKEVLHTFADEEKKHLTMLGDPGKDTDGGSVFKYTTVVRLTCPIRPYCRLLALCYSSLSV